MQMRLSKSGNFFFFFYFLLRHPHWGTARETKGVPWRRRRCRRRMETRGNRTAISLHCDMMMIIEVERATITSILRRWRRRWRRRRRRRRPEIARHERDKRQREREREKGVLTTTTTSRRVSMCRWPHPFHASHHHHHWTLDRGEKRRDLAFSWWRWRTEEESLLSLRRAFASTRRLSSSILCFCVYNNNNNNNKKKDTSSSLSSSPFRRWSVRDDGDNNNNNNEKEGGDPAHRTARHGRTDGRTVFLGIRLGSFHRIAHTDRDGDKRFLCTLPPPPPSPQSPPPPRSAEYEYCIR